MVLRFYKPYTSGVRHRCGVYFRSYGKKGKKSLKRAFQPCYGRNHSGSITQRYRCKGHKRYYRAVQKRGFIDTIGFIQGVHYDPYRNARLGLVCGLNSAPRYMLMPEGLTLGMGVVASVKAALNIGKGLPLHLIPLGSLEKNETLNHPLGFNTNIKVDSTSIKKSLAI